MQMQLIHLLAFPFLNSQAVLEGLKGEFTSYLAKVSDIDTDIEILQWWQHNESALPCWAAATRGGFTCTAFICSIRKGFFITKFFFYQQQQSSL